MNMGVLYCVIFLIFVYEQCIYGNVFKFIVNSAYNFIKEIELYLLFSHNMPIWAISYHMESDMLKPIAYY